MPPRYDRETLKSLGAMYIMIAVTACAGPLCKELLSPQWGGEGTLALSQVVLFHGCYDGDTCTFSFPTLPPIFGDRIPVRLAGIDTPEMHGRCPREASLAREARAFTETFLARAKQIEITDLRRDKYFRLDARVKADGQDLSIALLKAGLAELYDGGTKTARWC